MKAIQLAVIGFFAAIIVMIIYFPGGKGKGMSGGQQSAMAINAIGSAGSNIAQSFKY